MALFETTASRCGFAIAIDRTDFSGKIDQLRSTTARCYLGGRVKFQLDLYVATFWTCFSHDLQLAISFFDVPIEGFNLAQVDLAGTCLCHRLNMEFYSNINRSACCLPFWGWCFPTCGVPDGTLHRFPLDDIAVVGRAVNAGFVKKQTGELRHGLGSLFCLLVSRFGYGLLPGAALSFFVKRTV